MSDDISKKLKLRVSNIVRKTEHVSHFICVIFSVLVKHIVVIFTPN